ncbi:hypothetical protein STW0522KLE44_08370 [Klebsiella sp. STW0522-44]|nr:hypothetical protein STW0522KLE44_08370 [Klebsiella sp. STW0522-44]
MMGDEAVIFDIFTAWRGGMASVSIDICVFAVSSTRHNIRADETRLPGGGNIPTPHNNMNLLIKLDAIQEKQQHVLFKITDKFKYLFFDRILYSP